MRRWEDNIKAKLERIAVMVCKGLICVRIGFSGVILGTSRFHKRQGIPQPKVQDAASNRRKRPGISARIKYINAANHCFQNGDVTYAGLSLQPVNFEQIMKSHTNSEFRTYTMRQRAVSSLPG
jgi:hypothetical protein